MRGFLPSENYTAVSQSKHVGGNEICAECFQSSEGHKICQEFNEIEFHQQLVKLINGLTVIFIFPV